MWRVILLSCWVGLALGLTKQGLYPFGDDQLDKRLPVGDDISSEEVQLSTPVAFYDNLFTSLFVNLNGHVSFETEIPAFKSDLIIPVFGFKLIAPYLADADNRLSGNVYYRESMDPALLDLVTREVTTNWPTRRNFRASHIFIVTWDEVGYYDRQYDKVNTFQLVLANNGAESYALFHYTDDGIQWIRGQGKARPVTNDVPAQAGFNAGDSVRYTTLPGSGSENIKDLAVLSNIAVPGVWVYRIGLTSGGNVESPETYIPPGLDRLNPSQPKTCATGGAQACSQSSRCKDYQGGFCCECPAPLLGNGKHCLKEDTRVRINGKVTGTVNGISIDAQDLYSYVVTKDGRAHTAISRIPANIGVPLQSAYAIGDIIGWLFGKPSTPNAKNGFMLTGGAFNRTARIQYVDGGITLEVQQQFTGLDVEGYMRVNTQLNGKVPNLAQTSKVTVDDYKVEFSKVGRGLIKSYTTQLYNVDGIPKRINIDQTIRFEECVHRPDDDANMMRLDVFRNSLVYGERDQIVRFGQTNKISSAGESTDPCQAGRNDCDQNANCVPTGDTYRCECKAGFYGDGRRCADEDECSRGNNDCSPEATCYNTEGSFTCRCLPGYRGDGKSCQRVSERTCAEISCDRNARCLRDERGNPVCQCNPGYYGDGQMCQAVEGEEECNILNNCHANARCIFDSQTRGYTCICNPGSRGDGYRCEPEQVGPVACNIANNCDLNARCNFIDQTRRYECRCNPGYAGDGYRCVEDCSVRNFCDGNAQCQFEAQLQAHSCVCRPGFEGDGRQCRLAGDCSVDPSVCDRNARCARRGGLYICECNQGYEGDGRRCAPTGDKESYLMYAQGTAIIQIPYQPTKENPGRVAMIVPGQTAIGIDADCFSRYYYWTDVSGHSISRAKLDGSDSEVILRDLSSPEGVAIDWISGTMYWTDSGSDKIEVAKVDGSYRKTLFDTNLVNPRAIAVDPASGLVFWTDWNRASPKVESAYMDGSQRTSVISDNLGLPNGLSIDYDQRQICWADAGTTKIECAGYDGRGRRIIYAKASYPFGLVYVNNNFYWTDWQEKNLPNIGRFGGQPNESLKVPVGSSGRSYGIAAVRSECPRGSNACAVNNGGCRYLCLPTPNGGRTCACPDNVDEAECNTIIR